MIRDIFCMGFLNKEDLHSVPLGERRLMGRGGLWFYNPHVGVSQLWSLFCSRWPRAQRATERSGGGSALPDPTPTLACWGFSTSPRTPGGLPLNVRFRVPVSCRVSLRAAAAAEDKETITAPSPLARSALWAPVTLGTELGQPRKLGNKE